MPTLLLSCVFVLVAPAEAATPIGWMAGAHVGAGYDGNIDASSSLVDAQGAANWAAGASIGGWVAPRRTRLLLGLRYDTAQLPAFPELSSHAAFGSLGFRAPVAWHLDLSLGPFAGGRWSADVARSSLDLGGTAGLGWRARPWLRADVGYRFLHRDAGDEVFNRDAHAGQLAAEVRLARQTYLILSASAEYGEAVFYDTRNVDVNADADVYVSKSGGEGGAGDGGAHGSGAAPDGAPQTTTDSFGITVIAWSAPAVSATVELGLDQELGRHVTVGVRAGFLNVSAEPASWQDVYGSLDLRVRAP